MPTIDIYPPARIDACRAEFKALIGAYRDVVAAASKASGASLVRVDGALAAFEPGLFNNLLVALDARFVHRGRDEHGGASRNGGPLDEVRLLVDALTVRGGVLAADAAIPYDPGRSVLGIDIGDRIALAADDFEAIAAAFLAEIERRYT